MTKMNDWNSPIPNDKLMAAALPYQRGYRDITDLARRAYQYVS
ncbi:hypothetical protein [Xenorhabdus sp. TS4]|nr:hypothetical protein [Xenorhabdus sp. TS4]